MKVQCKLKSDLRQAFSTSPIILLILKPRVQSENHMPLIGVSEHREHPTSFMNMPPTAP